MPLKFLNLKNKQQQITTQRDLPKRLNNMWKLFLVFWGAQIEYSITE